MRSSSGVASARSMLVLGHGRWWKTHLCAKPGVCATASLPNVGNRGSLQLRNFCSGVWWLSPDPVGTVRICGVGLLHG